LRVRVLFFSLYSDAAGSEAVVELNPGSSVRELVEKLTEAYPKLQVLFNQVKPLVLVNGSLAQPDHILSEGDEVAIIPPASGG